MVVCSRCNLASAVLQLLQLNKLLHLSMVVCSRCNLASVVLQLLGLNITRVLTFDFIDPPSEDVSSAFPFFPVRLYRIENERLAVYLVFCGNCSHYSVQRQPVAEDGDIAQW